MITFKTISLQIVTKTFSVMSTSNHTTKFKNVKTYDFQTLYTKIPQDMLKGKLEEFIGYVFHIKESKFINIL